MLSCGKNGFYKTECPINTFIYYYKCCGDYNNECCYMVYPVFYYAGIVLFMILLLLCCCGCYLLLKSYQKPKHEPISLTKQWHLSDEGQAVMFNVALFPK